MKEFRPFRRFPGRLWNPRRSRRRTLTVHRSGECPEPRVLLAVTVDLVADINQTERTEPYVGPLAHGDSFSFLAGQSTAHGRELWVTDGTNAGTHLVRDIEPGPWSSGIHSLTVVGNTAFFGSRQVGNWQEILWRSDGSAEGTTIVTEDQLQTLSENGFRVATDDSLIYGTTGYSAKVWRLAATPGASPIRILPVGAAVSPGPYSSAVSIPGGTFLLNVFGPVSLVRPESTEAEAFGNFSRIGQARAVGDRLLFEAAPAGSSPTDPLETWITDGTTAGTIRMDLPDRVTWETIAAGSTNQICFLRESDTGTWELWQGSVTTGATHLVFDTGGLIWTGRGQSGGVVSGNWIYYGTREQNLRSQL